MGSCRKSHTSPHPKRKVANKPEGKAYNDRRCFDSSLVDMSLMLCMKIRPSWFLEDIGFGSSCRTCHSSSGVCRTRLEDWVHIHICSFCSKTWEDSWSWHIGTRSNTPRHCIEVRCIFGFGRWGHKGIRTCCSEGCRLCHLGTQEFGHICWHWGMFLLGRRMHKWRDPKLGHWYKQFEEGGRIQSSKFCCQDIRRTFPHRSIFGRWSRGSKYSSCCSRRFRRDIRKPTCSGSTSFLRGIAASLDIVCCATPSLEDTHISTKAHPKFVRICISGISLYPISTGQDKRTQKFSSPISDLLRIQVGCGIVSHSSTLLRDTHSVGRLHSKLGCHCTHRFSCRWFRSICSRMGINKFSPDSSILVRWCIPNKLSRWSSSLLDRCIWFHPRSVLPRSSKTYIFLHSRTCLRGRHTGNEHRGLCLLHTGEFPYKLILSSTCDQGTCNCRCKRPILVRSGSQVAWHKRTHSTWEDMDIHNFCFHGWTLCLLYKEYTFLHSNSKSVGIRSSGWMGWGIGLWDMRPGSQYHSSIYLHHRTSRHFQEWGRYWEDRRWHNFPRRKCDNQDSLRTQSQWRKYSRKWGIE